MKKNITLLALILTLLAAAFNVQPARAVSAVVGNGSAASCTEAAFDTALGFANSGSGGMVTFNCGAAVKTILFTSQKSIFANNVTINGNDLIVLSGGNSTGIFYVNGGLTFRLQHITLSSGNSGAEGGAVYSIGSQVILDTVQLLNNTATNMGGAVYCYVGTGGALAVSNSLFQSNTSKAGGAIFNDGCAASISNSTFKTNQADIGSGGLGGAIHNASSATLAIDNSLLEGNSALDGGGVYVSGGTASIANTTISGNQAVGAAANGGGIYNSGIMNLKNNTISGNAAAIDGGGVYNAGTLNQFNNIIANSTGGDCRNTSVLTGNNNLIESTGSAACGLTNGVSGNIIGFDPKLGALIGSPAYFPLLAGSLAIDTGDDVICASAPVSNTSQNGFTRPQGAHCDIGTYEYVKMVQRAKNGGFNQYGTGKIPTSWKAVNFSATDGKFTTTKKEGTASVKIAGASGKTKTLTQMLTTLSGAAGNAFTFSYWVKGSAVPKLGGLCQAQVLFYVDTAVKGTSIVKCPTGNYNWKNVKLSFIAPVAYTKVAIKFTYSKASGTIYLDGASLLK